MAFCNEHGIKHSEFLQEWSDADRVKALAFVIESGLKCGLCGTAEWEWDLDKQAYVPARKFCWGCYYREVANEDELSTGQSVVLVQNSEEYQRRSEQHALKLKALEHRDGVGRESASRSGHKH